MITFENTEVLGWEHAVRGMRNPMNSWEKSDSGKIYWNGTWYTNDPVIRSYLTDYGINLMLGPNDLDLMKRLRNVGTDHRKFMRMIIVYVDITAPLYWWKEFDTYKVGTVANSCSTMHKIADKEFTIDDFSLEHLIRPGDNSYVYIRDDEANRDLSPYEIMYEYVIQMLNASREAYLKTKDKKYWWQMIQLLPSSYNQKRTVMMNYEVLANIYKSRKNHKLDEWSEHTKEEIIKDALNGKFGFCDWLKTLPYSDLITGPSLSDIPIANEIMEEAEKRPRSTTAGLESKSDNFGNRPRCVECIYFRKVSEVTGNCSRFKIPVDIEDCCVENDS